MSIQSSVSLRPFNTFRMDETAARYVAIDTVEEALALAKTLREAPERVRVLGGGSNILLTGPVDGLVVHNRIPGIAREGITVSGRTVFLTAGAGVGWHALVMHTLNLGLAGLENLALIPGTVGASPIQNIGAYGAEVKDCLEAVEWLDWETGQLRIFFTKDCGLGYRTSVFKTELAGRGMITRVCFRLDAQKEKKATLKLDYGAIRQALDNAGIRTPTAKDVAASVIRIRKSKLPDPAVVGNAGSFFKNPEVPLELFDRLKALHPAMPGYPAGEGRVKTAAGWLIEQAGWKGRRLGNAGVHDRQALVLVNTGGASGAEVLKLADAVVADVENRFEIRLEKEVQIW